MSKARPLPSERPSDEADAQQLKLAQREGDAYHAALRYMVEQVADTGAQQRAGDYIVAFAQERAEGMYHLHGDGDLRWMEPAEGENCHLEISVSDAADHRFIPYLTIHATLTAQDGQQIGPVEIPFVWHPGLYHYGRNLTVPGDGSYTIRVQFDPPRFMRHDKVNGRRYAEPVDVEFRDVHVKTGRE